MIYLLIIPFLANLMIVLNVYNGDVLGIPSEIEYLLWYLLPALVSIFKIGITKSIKKYHNLYLGIILMIFWYFESPFRSDKQIRHRTEYYDTHTLMCVLLYHSIFESLREKGVLV
tara:strand:- start:6 stop:350 length:345 start_codon:yes stop_codon:yes gene_type:complete